MGIKGREIIGKSVLEVFPNAKAEFSGAYEAALRGETVGAQALWVDLPDGRRACLALRDHPLEGAGRRRRRAPGLRTRQSRDAAGAGGVPAG
jgi:hypothetical protein